MIDDAVAIIEVFEVIVGISKQLLKSNRDGVVSEAFAIGRSDEFIHFVPNLSIGQLLLELSLQLVTIATFVFIIFQFMVDFADALGGLIAFCLICLGFLGDILSRFFGEIFGTMLIELFVFKGDLRVNFGLSIAQQFVLLF